MKKPPLLIAPLLVFAMLGYLWVITRVLYAPSFPEQVANRFVEQVNTNTCNQPSGLEFDPTMWADACSAAIADLAPGTRLSPPKEAPLNTVLTGYLSVNGFPASLTFRFTYEGLMPPFDLELRIASESNTFIGLSSPIGGQLIGEPVSVAVDADAQALVEQVHTLLVDDRCADLNALMVPPDLLTAAASATPPPERASNACEAIVTMVQPGSPYDRWGGFEYEAQDWGCSACGLASDPAASVFPQGTSDGVEVKGSVVTGAATVNDDEDPLYPPRYRITVMEYEDQWYVLSVDVVSNSFAFDF